MRIVLSAWAKSRHSKMRGIRLTLILDEMLRNVGHFAAVGTQLVGHPTSGLKNAINPLRKFALAWQPESRPLLTGRQLLGVRVRARLS